MKSCYAVSLLALLFIGAESRFFELRSEVSPRCVKINNFLTRVLAETRTSYQELYTEFGMLANVNFGVDVNDPAQVKQLSCKLANVHTLKAFHRLLLQHDQLPYDGFVEGYKENQRNLAGIGGYTNANRLVMLANDVIAWNKGLNVNSTTPAEATTLAELTKFFEVMQVKYGSRWISYLGINLDTVITNPSETARKLYESKSNVDVGKALGLDLNEHKELYTARQTWNLILLDSNKFRNKPLPPIHLYAAYNFIGEMGFFTLEY